MALGGGSLGRVALRAAERVEQSLGPAMGLRSYRALFVQKDGEVRLAAVRGALRCMFVLGLFDGVDDAATAWEGCRSASSDPASTEEMAVHCRVLVKQGRPEVAGRLADAEVARSGSARAWYLAARVRDALGDDGARDAFRQAIAKSSDGEVAISARAALLERALAEGDEASGEGLEEGNDDQRLLAAAAALQSRSQFRRASGLSILAELADGPRGRQAVALAAEHADGMGMLLSWVEAERLEAVLIRAGWLASEKAETALRRLRARRRLAGAWSSEVREEALAEALAEEKGGARHVDLARAVARGEDVDPDELDVAAGVPAAAAQALVVVDALVRGDARVAERGLAALADDPGEPSVEGAWTAARLALDSERHRERAAVLVRRLLDGPGRPARGWLVLVAALRGADQEGLASEVLERACAMGEAGAIAERVAWLVKTAWAAHAAGERDEAIALLERARALDEGASDGP